jgi:hypothetical protein
MDLAIWLAVWSLVIGVSAWKRKPVFLVVQPIMLGWLRAILRARGWLGS